MTRAEFRDLLAVALSDCAVITDVDPIDERTPGVQCDRGRRFLLDIEAVDEDRP